MCSRRDSGADIDSLLTESLARPGPDEVRRARAASVRAFNRIEKVRREEGAQARRRSTQRKLVLAGGWLVSLTLIARALVWLAAGVSPVAVADGIPPPLRFAADALSLAPWHLFAGLVLLACTLVFSVSQLLAED